MRRCHPFNASEDPTAGGRQVVGVPTFHVVAVLEPRFESLPQPQLDQTPVSCIDRLYLIRAPWWQQPKQSVSPLLELFLQLPRRLPVHIVGEKDGLLRGHHARTSCHGGFERLPTHRLQYEVSLSAQAQPCNSTSTSGCHAAFSTLLIRFPAFRKMMPGTPISWDTNERVCVTTLSCLLQRLCRQTYPNATLARALAGTRRAFV